MEFQILYTIQKMHGPLLDELMTGITFLGDKGWFWILLAAVFLCIKKTRPLGLAMAVSIAAGALIGNLALKPLVARQRPCWLDPSVALLIANPGDFSFPSGHTLVSFEGAVSIFLYNRKWGWWALALAVLIAFSRLYLFVHFPTDVLAGAALGTAIALAAYGAVHRAVSGAAHRTVSGAPDRNTKKR